MVLEGKDHAVLHLIATTRKDSLLVSHVLPHLTGDYLRVFSLRGNTSSMLLPEKAHSNNFLLSCCYKELQYLCSICPSFRGSYNTFHEK